MMERAFSDTHYLVLVRKGSFLSQPGFPFRIQRVSRRGRGGVVDLPIGLGRFQALHPTL